MPPAPDNYKLSEGIWLSWLWERSLFDYSCWVISAMRCDKLYQTSLALVDSSFPYLWNFDRYSTCLILVRRHHLCIFLMAISPYLKTFPARLFLFLLPKSIWGNVLERRNSNLLVLHEWHVMGCVVTHVKMRLLHLQNVMLRTWTLLICFSIPTLKIVPLFVQALAPANCVVQPLLQYLRISIGL